MGVGVDLHIDLLVEPLPAVLADERLVVGVGPHVRVQVGRPVERLMEEDYQKYTFDREISWK